MSMDAMMPEQTMDMSMEVPGESEPLEQRPDELEPEVKDTTPEPEPTQMDAGTGDPEPTYDADFQFKYKDETHEFDETLRSAIVNKETEDHLRDIYTKAKGFDDFKGRFESRDTDFNELQTKQSELATENQQFRTGMDRLNDLKQNDFMGFQKSWGINDQSILQRAREIISHQENPDQANVANQAWEHNQQNWNLQQQQQVNAANNDSVVQELHGLKMDKAMSAPEINEFAKQYDQRMGAGAFKAEVDEVGTHAHFNEKRYLEPQISVSRAYEKLNKHFVPAPSQGEPQAQMGNDRPVASIPNLGRGKSGSPTRKAVNTLAELRQRAQELANQ